MKFYILSLTIILFSCQPQSESLQCEQEICIQLRNHDSSNKTFDLYMKNSVSIAGFQCDFPLINIIETDGGLLKDNEYQTQNSADRIISFSMQAQLIPPGEALLTKIWYTNSSDKICMEDIIFAGEGGKQLSNNIPKCIE